MPGRTSRAIRSAVVKAFEAGEDTRVICRKFNVGPNSIYRWIRAVGIEPHRLNKVFDVPTAKLMYEKGGRLQDVAKHFSCSQAYAYERLKDHVVFDSVGRRSGPAHWHWKGGISLTSWYDLRTNPQYIAWKSAVHTRDGYVCMLCGEQSQWPHAHHIEMKADRPELIFDVSNGITLCTECHNKIVTTREGVFANMFRDAISVGRPLPWAIYNWFAAIFLNIEPRPCCCGCGLLTRIFHGKPNQYIHGHHRRKVRV